MLLEEQMRKLKALLKIYFSASDGERLNFWSVVIGIVASVGLAYGTTAWQTKEARTANAKSKNSELVVLLASELSNCREIISKAGSTADGSSLMASYQQSLVSCRMKLTAPMAGIRVLQNDLKALEADQQIESQNLYRLTMTLDQHMYKAIGDLQTHILSGHRSMRAEQALIDQVLSLVNVPGDAISIRLIEDTLTGRHHE